MKSPDSIRSSNWFSRLFLVAKKLTPQAVQDKADQDGPEAQNNLGVLFMHGAPFPPDFSAAARCFQNAADQGNALAQVNLGLMHTRGEGVATNPAEAAKWFLRAAEQGDASAQFKLGTNSHRSSFDLAGAEADEARITALKWFRLAAAQGFHNAEAACGSLIVKMTHAELAESNRRVAAFTAKLFRPLPES